MRSLRHFAAPGALILAVIIACSKENAANVVSDQVSYARPEAGAPTAAPEPMRSAPPPAEAVDAGLAVGQATVTQPDVLAGTMLIRTGVASVEVRALDSAIARVREMARRIGAVVANVSMETGRDQVPSASLELRIPTARFDEAVAGLTPVGKVEAVNVTVEDVGEEYADIEARVANARKLEQRLIELLANRTGRLSDVLAVERELARVREEIERYEGRMRYLRTRASVSRLTVTVHEAPPLVLNGPGQRPIRDAIVGAWRNFIGFVASLIAALGWMIPVGVLVYGAYRLLRGRMPRWFRRGGGGGAPPAVPGEESRPVKAA